MSLILTQKNSMKIVITVESQLKFPGYSQRQSSSFNIYIKQKKIIIEYFWNELKFLNFVRWI